MQENSALGRAMAMVRDLRVRCPWDRAQTRETLRPYLVEEVLEVDQAIGSGDPALLRDEMGDFLLHLAWQLVLAEELGEFTAERPITWTIFPMFFSPAIMKTSGGGEERKV